MVLGDGGGGARREVIPQDQPPPLLAVRLLAYRLFASSIPLVFFVPPLCSLC